MLHTARLSLAPLQTTDAAFIFELVNTPGWLRFIGDRNVRSVEDAVAYIGRILQNQQVKYWIARTREDGSSIGVVTIIQRDYLEYNDLGFAFLPQLGQKGYALEAAKAVAGHLLETYDQPQVLATTLPDNDRSIRLLQKLGFEQQRVLDLNGEPLLLYGVDVPVLKEKILGDH